MANINLLPWRENLREERKKRYFAVMFGVVIIAAGSVFLADRYVRTEIQEQQARNDYLRTQIVLLDEMVAEISDLQERKQEISNRMNVIQDLQGSRPVIVRVFDELVNTLPDGVYFQTLDRVGDNLNIVGVAESYSRLTELMRKLDSSAWFADPNLRIISAAENEGFSDDAANRFNLNLSLVSPRDRDESNQPEINTNEVALQ